MNNEKELNQFRALDFDEDDILFSSLVATTLKERLWKILRN